MPNEKVERQFTWTDKKIEWYKRASEFTKYNKNIAEIVISEIGEGKSIWDLGSGMSYLSIELSKKSKKITCVDVDNNVLVELEKTINEKGINNVQIVNSDYIEFIKGEEIVDCIIISHFLDTNENIGNLLAKCEKLIVIKNSKKREEGLNRSSRQNIEDVESMVKNVKELKYSKKFYRGDFGQPLKSLKEAKEYYELYTGCKIKEEVLNKNITMTEDQFYPFYYPKNKVVGILKIEKVKE